MTYLLTAGLAVFGLLFCGVGVNHVLGARWLAANGVRAYAVVTRLRWQSSDNGGVHYPTLRFQTRDGAWLEVESDIGSSPAPAEVGRQVVVVYDPRDPRRARVDTPLGSGALLGWIFTVIGALVVVAAVVVVMVTGASAG
ncbi:DUF3592 domain-containing protein [Nonomuraea sp. NPDC050556]|uniref:DUF3592 domain-containing protein n=1 Tax=Nonomuraea sp. NPDC050556 TaxID=3364369 RepID=UPI0037901066